jgi:uncharacterized protein YjbI with pentapeptide repeats
MTLRDTLLCLTLATALGAPAAASTAGEREGPHRGLVIGGDCVGCTFEESNLAGAQIIGGDFSQTTFREAELLGARLIDLNLAGANFRDASMLEVRFDNVGLDGANLRDANLERGRLHRVRMTGADLRDAHFDDAVFLIVDMTGANLSDAHASRTIFRQTDLTGVQAQSVHFDGSHFIGSRLARADLRRANLREAIFENVDLTGADLRNSDLGDARFVAVNLTGADLRGADGLGAASFTHVCGSQVEGLPEGVSLRTCSGEARAVQEEQIRVAVAATREALRSQRETRRAQIEQARAAFEQALADIEVEMGQSDRVRLEALAAAREGWEAAAEALAVAEAGMDNPNADMSWTFDIRRAELGEPIRVILEQARPQQTFVLVPRADSLPPPPMPPAPEVPRRVETEISIAPGVAVEFARETEVRSTGNPEAEASAEAAASTDASSDAAAELSADRDASTPGLSAAAIAYLIEATADQFSDGENAATLPFDNVQAGTRAAGDGTRAPLLCGQVNLNPQTPSSQPTAFVTVSQGDSYFLSFGTDARAVCDSPETVIQPSADLAIRIERRLSRLSED